MKKQPHSPRHPKIRAGARAQATPKRRPRRRAPHEVRPPLQLLEQKLKELLRTREEFARRNEALQARQAQLGESETQLRLAVETAELGTYVRDVGTNKVTMNSICRRILGADEGAVPPDVAYRSVYPEDAERVLSAVKRAFDPALREVCGAEFRIVRPDGTVRWVSGQGRVLFDDTATPPRPIKFVGVVQDVTNRKTVEEALRESEEKFRAFFHTAAVGAAQMGLDQRFHEVNDRFCAITGYSREELLGLTPANLWPAEDRAREAADLAEHLAGRVPTFETRKRYVRKDGQVIWVQVTGALLRGAGGEPIRSVGVIQDITARERAQEQLRQAQELLRRHAESLEEAVQERTTQLRQTIGDLEHFSYSITHDMRAPLRAMRSFSNLLLTDFSSGLPPAAQDFLQRIDRAADRMDQLIVDALDYSKAVREELPLVALDPEALLRGIIESHPAFQSPKARIQIAPPLPRVLANAAGLTQCFTNLLNNAAKFVQPGQVPEVRVRAEKRDTMVRLWFEDNGIGIPPECHERIFGMFQRLSSHYEGTGIGLALVRKVMEKMRGQVGVESELGRGSRFWLELKADASQ